MVTSSTPDRNVGWAAAPSPAVSACQAAAKLAANTSAITLINGIIMSLVMRTLPDLRRFAVSRSLFPQTTLESALERFGFVQADPIRSPARAQDLTLRPRVKDYRAGDLESRYA